jgi:GNAT superfamily N-acetyltransferase
MIRDAVQTDAEDLVRLVRGLAQYERAAEAVEVTVEGLRDLLFRHDPKVFALVADSGGSVVGMAVYFVSFSTWTGRHGLYLEDLFVEPEHRCRGIGRSLVRALAQRAAELGYARLEWAVLDWNEPALGFYRSLGAVPMDGWTTYRLSGQALADLARSAPERGKS